ncbi:MAG: hypothetical protein JWM53_5839 [bacterium]|nr:hypothetical protein [bacterium]
MNRGWARTLVLTSLLPLLASLGCDALTVRSFAGTVMEFTISGVTPTSLPAGQHLELWARTQYDDIVRVDGYTNLSLGETANGVMIRQAISLKDPCTIDGYYYPNEINDPTKGNLLTSEAAYPTSLSAGGVTQTPKEQAQQVIDRIHQLTDAAGAVAPLAAVLPYDANVPPAVPDTATPAERKAACDAYYYASKLTYIPNPYQVTAPLHGDVYGFVSFTSLTPPANYDGFRIDTPLNLQGAREIFFTVEGATVDPKHRGPLFLSSQLTQGGRDVIHFNLTHADPMGTALGTAALLFGLDQDPVQF